MTDDDVLFVHDGATSVFDSVETDGITVDDDGQASFDWSEVPVVELDQPPHARAFDTDRFYKIEGATTARPIKQPYRVGDDVEVYVKPADELRDAAWSLDNRPFVLDHPNSGMVKDVADVHGFWRNPRYNDDEDRLKEDLYIPVNDEPAREFVSDNQDVSLGFYNRLHSDYDGDIGGLVEDTSDVDGYQTNLFVDHIAGVERGRCSSAHGCGLDGGHDHGEVVLKTDDTTSFLTREDQTRKEKGSDVDEQHDRDYEISPTVDSMDGITFDYTNDEGRYFAVSPDEGGGEPKYPINNCSDVSDAWKLRSHGDISISVDTLEDRIQSKARDLGCEVPGTEGDSTMTDDDIDNGGDFDIPDLSIDALAEKHDDVRELREANDELESDLESIADALGLDEGECPCEVDFDSYTEAKETVESLRDTFEADDVDLVEFAEDMHEEWQEARDEKREELLEALEDLKADREEWEDAEIEEIEQEIDRREEIAEDFDATGAGGSTEDAGGDTDTDITGRRSFGRGHAANA